MRVNLSYTLPEWHALADLVTRPGAPALSEPDLPSRVYNAVAWSWLQGVRVATVEAAPDDAALLRDLRTRLPDTEALAAIGEAERIVREHQRRHARR